MDAGDAAINWGIFLPNWVGDVVMATPALRAIRQSAGPESRLIGIVRPYVADVLAGTSWLDALVPFDRRSTDVRLHTRPVIQHLRQLQMDRVILMTNSLRSAWMAWRAGIPERIGYARYGRGPLLTRPLYAPRQHWRRSPISAVDYYLGLAEASGASHGQRQLELATTEMDEQQADGLWRCWKLTPSDTVVVLNGGGAYGSAKDWPRDYFAALARRLANDRGCKVVVTCGPAERTAAAEIVRLANCAGVSSAADAAVGLGLTKSLIKRAQLLISTDSGPRHFGAAFSVPTITLFGPTDPRWSHNYNPHAIDLQLNLPCGPCARRHCPLKHHRCMRELSVEQVYRAALEWLPRTETRRSA
jgi:heptosyltransferase-2